MNEEGEGRRHRTHRSRSWMTADTAFYLALLLLLFSLLPGSFIFDDARAAGTDNSPWPMFGHDGARRGWTDEDMGNNLGEVMWSVDVGPILRSSPCITRSGNILIGSRDGNLSAVSPEGRVIWKFQTEDEIVSSPSVDEQGYIYFGSLDGFLYVLDPGGGLEWRTYLGSPIRSSPLLDEESTTYIGSDEGKVFCIDRFGTIKWNYTTDASILASPAMMHDGRIVLPSMDQYVYCFNRNGSLSWRGMMASSSMSTPLVLHDNRIVVGSNSGYIYCFLFNGSLSWEYEVGGIVSSSPSLGEGGYIYAGSDSGELLKLFDHGDIEWDYDTFSDIGTSPLVTGDDRIVFGNNEGYLFCLYEDKELRWKTDLGSEITSSAAMAPGGIIYAATNDGILYAVGTKVREPPSPPTDLTLLPTMGGNLLDWEPPESLGNLTLLGYRVSRRNGTSGDVKVIATLDPIETELLDNSAVPETTYLYWVNAFNGEGTSPDSAPRTCVTIREKRSPSPPLDLVLTSDDTTITLSWEPPEDPGTSEVRGYYVVELTPEYEVENVFHVGDTLWIDIEGLDHGRNYVFAVFAYNDEGDSSYSEYRIGRLKVEEDPLVSGDDDSSADVGSTTVEDVFGAICCFLFLGVFILIPMGLAIYKAFKNRGKEEEKKETHKPTFDPGQVQHTIRAGHRDRSFPAGGWGVSSSTSYEPAKKERRKGPSPATPVHGKRPEKGISMMDEMSDDMIVDRILELNEMLDEGVIDREEYSVMKSRLVKRS